MAKINKLKIDGVLYDIGSEQTGGGAWGEITGNIEDQTDLKNALDGKVSPTDYATESTGGVIKPNSQYYGTAVSAGGALNATTKTFSAYSSAQDNLFIGKGTLENVITGKGLVKNTDYATGATGGVVKVGDAYGIGINTQSGNIYPISQSYAQYQSASNYSFVGKGTLNNVIAGKQLVSQSDISDVIRTTDEGVIRDTNIADGAVTTSKIADGTVTVSKLDASTIDYSVGNPTSGDSITLTQSWQAIIQSGTLPAGTYLVFCEWYYNVTSLSGDMNDVHVTIATSAANAATTQLTNEGIYNGWNHGARTCIRRVVLDSNNKIGLYMKRVTTSGTVITSANRCSLNIIRVA